VQSYVELSERDDITAIAAAKDQSLVDHVASLIRKDIKQNKALIPIGQERLKEPRRYKTKRMQLEAENRHLLNLIKSPSHKLGYPITSL